MGENQEEILSIDKFGEVQVRSKRKDRNKEKAGTKKRGERGGTL